MTFTFHPVLGHQLGEKSYTVTMAVVEDYIPDSDDEDVQRPPTPAPEEPARPVEEQSIKGSSVSDLVERLHVPPEFGDAFKASQLRKSNPEPSHIPLMNT